jgi:hypothetical protein
MDRNGNAVISGATDCGPDCTPVEELAVVRCPNGALGPYQTLSTTGKNLTWR